MPRKPRVIDPDSYYHVTGRGNDRQKLFYDIRDYHEYFSMLDTARNHYRFDLPHFVLMPNHVHLLIRPNSLRMPEFMHRINLGFAKYFCKRHDFKGHVWQGRYHSVRMESDAQLYACGKYIENNPVHAGLVCHAAEWPFSSAYEVPGTKKKNPA